MERTIGYAPGDVLVWYTDGLTEGESAQGEAFGEKRLRRCVEGALDRGPDAILERVLQEADAHFASFARPEDDVTLVVGRFEG